jgi:parallel beta-helix repeat protein
MRRSVQFEYLFLAVVGLCFSQFVAAQNTINVPRDQATIQGAINVANPGDTVLVAPGTYSENINFNGKAITVTSSGGAAQTVIDGGGKGPVVIFHTGEGLGSVLNSFTIQNGSSLNTSLGTSFDGAGISISSASPTITNNVVQNNSGCDGGGMAVEFSSALVQGNTITNNNDFQCSGGSGAGIWIAGSGSAQIIGNVITNNMATSAGSGGGIVLFAAGTPTLRNNIIAGNATGGTSPATQGGGIWIVNQSDALIVQNLIYNNVAQQGSGIYLLVPSGDVGPTLVNNTIIGAPGATQGAALYVSGFDNQVRLLNNLLIGSSGENAVYCDGLYQPQPPVFSNDDVFSSNGAGFQGTCASSGGQNGNIAADPLFVSAPVGDLHLQNNSPAIDAGTNSAPNLPQTDFGGSPRILDGNNDCVSTVDLGAYEVARTANVSFSTTALSFPSQVPGTSSAPQSLALRNSGGTCFQFSSVRIAGDFSQSNTCSAMGLRAGNSCVFSITFTPVALGASTGALTASGSDGITFATATVSLSGIGADFSITAAPSSATVKHGQSANFTVALSPIGGNFTSAIALSCSGLPAGAACSFSPASVTLGNQATTSTLLVSTTGKTSRGKFNLVITGAAASDSHSTVVLLNVN